MPATSSISYTDRALRYARDVVAGKIAACKWVRLACQRQIDDLERWKPKGSPFQWRVDKAEEICDFIELLPHIKGEWARRREKIRLEDWQCFILTTVFGWYGADGTRRFRTVYIEVPRKNAKSTLSSGVGLYMLTADDEAGAEVYSAATTRDQAKIVFNVAQDMARRDADFREAFGVQVGAHNINVLDMASKFEALSADGSTLDGLNIHCGIVDELHAHKQRDVWDVLETATGSRSQPLVWTITTAGDNRSGICYEQRTYVTRLLEKIFDDDPTYFGIIFTIDIDPYDAVVSGLPEALLELDISCSCGLVHPTQIEQYWREACVRHATTNGIDQKGRSAAKSTQTEMSGVEACAVPVTSNGCLTETQSTKLAQERSNRSGRQTTETRLGQRTSVGESVMGVDISSISSGYQSTKSPESNTTSYTDSSSGRAQSAPESTKLYALITATLKELSGDCSARNATLQLVSSETLNRVFSAHSSTCKARNCELLSDGSILVHREPDSWSEPAAWAKANPNYGISVKPDDLERKARKAMQMPSAQANFLTKHLNVWVSSEQGLFDMAAWDRAADRTLKIEDFKGLPCRTAIDLGFVDDIAAVVHLFETEDGFAVFSKNYLPEETVDDSRNSQYSGWVRSKRITATDGNITDIGQIVDDLAEFVSEYNPQEVSFDPYNKLILLKACSERGIDEGRLVEYPQTVALMSPPTERLMQLILSGKVKHDGDPVLAWALSNVVGHFDAKGNVYPKKERPENKIDPAIALIMALGRSMVGAQPTVAAWSLG